MTNTDSNKRDPFEAVRISEFRSLVTVRFLFIMGLRMMSTLVGWWIYELTNAPFAIGLIGLSEVIPAISMALYAGHIIDLSEKKKLMRTGLSLYLLAALVLVLLSSRFTDTRLSHHWIALRYHSLFHWPGVQCDPGAGST
jgi:MFS family permease